MSLPVSLALESPRSQAGVGRGRFALCCYHVLSVCLYQTITTLTIPLATPWVPVSLYALTDAVCALRQPPGDPREWGPISFFVGLR